MRILAWDPGEKGAFVYTDSKGRPYVMRMSSLLERCELTSYLFKVLKITDLVVYESQTFCAGIRVSAPSMGSFGCGYGEVLGAIKMAIVAGIGHCSIHGVTPQAWMKTVDAERVEKIKKPRGHNLVGAEKLSHELECREIDKLNSKGRLQWKRRLQESAQSHYPGVRVTLEICDALLISHYARRTFS